MSDDRTGDVDDRLEGIVRTAVIGEVPDQLREQLHALAPVPVDNIEVAPWMPAPAELQQPGDEGAALCDWRSAGHIIVLFAPSDEGTALSVRAEAFGPAAPEVRVQVARADDRFLELDAVGRVFVPAHLVFRVVVEASGIYVTDWIA